jgi:uncharacterized protein
MKLFKYLFAGVLFGFILTKGEVISWFRIFEMFKFQSFHMYGVIGSAVILGVIGVQIIKRKALKDIDGEEIKIADKDKTSFVRYILGGTIFGLGWAMTGACPGPMFIQVGAGYSVFIVTIVSATFGTFIYGVLRDKLPH